MLFVHQKRKYMYIYELWMGNFIVIFALFYFTSKDLFNLADSGRFSYSIAVFKYLMQIFFIDLNLRSISCNSFPILLGPSREVDEKHSKFFWLFDDCILFRNNMFLLDEITKRNASKFAIVWSMKTNTDFILGS